MISIKNVKESQLIFTILYIWIVLALPSLSAHLFYFLIYSFIQENVTKSLLTLLKDVTWFIFLMKIKTMYVDSATLDCVQVDGQKRKRRRVHGVLNAKYHFA